MLLNSPRFSGFVCMRRLAVRTNWPTVALKPERKALNGCTIPNVSSPSHINHHIPINAQHPATPSIPKCHPPPSVEDKSANGRRRGSELQQTYIIPHHHTIHKLQRPNNHQKRHERIHQLHPLRRPLHVVVPHRAHNLPHVLRVAHAGCLGRSGGGGRSAAGGSAADGLRAGGRHAVGRGGGAGGDDGGGGLGGGFSGRHCSIVGNRRRRTGGWR